MRDEAIRLLRDFSQAHGASGAEGGVRDIFLRELPSPGTTADRLGGLHFAPAGSGAGPRVMVTAHMDEVGFLVQTITPEGFVKFVNLGGWSENTLLAQRVRILTRAGRELPGVITSLPPHFTGGDGRTSPALDKLYIDTGLESAAAVFAAGVALGDAIVPDGPFVATAHPDRFLGKAFDNRAGCTVLAMVMKNLPAKLPCRVLGVATVQEEVGCRGAIVASEKAAPDVAIILEGPPADDTPGFSRSESQGALNGGVQIRLFDPSAIMSRPLADFIAGVATRRGIRHQITVRRSGGTDAKSIHLSGLGVPCVVIGVPARYIHTHGAMLDIRDLLACVGLTTALLEELTPDVVAGFTRFV